MQYKYRKLALDQFAVLAEQPLSPGTEISFNTDIEFGYEPGERILTNRLTLTASGATGVLLKAVMISDFEIAADSVAEMRDADGIIEFNPHVLVQFASLTYGALRGAIAVKAADTAVRDIVLPPVYFQTIINSGFRVEAE